MRRTYLEDFNKKTKYNQRKRYENKKYLLNCLKVYILLNIDTDRGLLEKDHLSDELLDELVLFFGSIFYPR